MKTVWERGGEIRKADGEAGYGVYAYVSPNSEMRKYYTANGETFYTIEPKENALFIDFTDKVLLNNLCAYMRECFERTKKTMQHYVPPKVNTENYQRFGSLIEDFIRRNYPNADGWIVLHKGTDIPTGKQVVIKNLDSVNIKEAIK